MYTSCSHSLLPAGYKSPARENSCRNSLKLNMRNWFPEWSWAMSEFDSDSGNETETPARQLARRPKNRPTGHKPTDPSKKSSSAPPSTADLPAKSEVVKAGKATKARLRAPPPTPASTAVPTPVPSLGQLATTPKDSQVACTLFPPKTFRSFSTSQSQRPVILPDLFSPEFMEKELDQPAPTIHTDLSIPVKTRLQQFNDELWEKIYPRW